MIKPNFKRGTQYFFVHKATLACAYLGGGLLLGDRKAVQLYLKPQGPRAEWHRVEINVIRTKAEAKAVNRKWAGMRNQRRAESQA
jgi:hypothetical protein